jgi:hypothetical protein
VHETRTRAARILAQGAAVARRAWLGTSLIVLAGLAIACGFYFRSQPKWIVPPAVRSYNQGLAAYHLPPGLLQASEERPSEYPIERATAYLRQAASESTDQKLRSLALYNLGTLIAREAYASSFGFGLLEAPRVEMNEAILWLAEATRLDPDNEDAKYNLEVLDRTGADQGQEEGAPGPGYSPGAVDKGY